MCESGVSLTASSWMTPTRGHRPCQVESGGSLRARQVESIGSNLRREAWHRGTPHDTKNGTPSRLASPPRNAVTPERKSKFVFDDGTHEAITPDVGHVHPLRMPDVCSEPELLA